MTTATQQMQTVNQMAEALKQCSEIGQNLINQRERYSKVAEVAIDLIGVMQAHLTHLSGPDQKRFAQDLKSRGLNAEQIQSFLGLIARKEG